jgi:flavin-dependent dehydrogenase
MKIAIVGAGIAGGYLARLLGQKGIFPDVYDAGGHDTRCGCRSCGWGAPVGIKQYLAGVDLDLEEYLIESMFSMNFDGLVAKTPLCTINKPRLLRDLCAGIRLKRQKPEPEEADTYDILVDATGITRALLPPCRSDLTLPTLQHRVVVESNGDNRLGEGVYGDRIPGLGYLWIFPVGSGQYHIGIGGIGLDHHESLMNRFYQESSDRFSFRQLCTCTGVVRVASPFYSTPFYWSKARKGETPQQVIGVGESIGTVSPFTGEGIVYSLECARILADSWQDPEGYTKKVLARFAWMKKERETLDYLLRQGRNGGPRLRDRWRFYRNARRSGITLPMFEAFRRMGSLSRWVDVSDR